MKSSNGPMLSRSQRSLLTALIWAWPVLAMIGVLLGQSFQRPQLTGLLMLAWLLSLTVCIPVLMSGDAPRDTH